MGTSTSYGCQDFSIVLVLNTQKTGAEWWNLFTVEGRIFCRLCKIHDAESFVLPPEQYSSCFLLDISAPYLRFSSACLLNFQSACSGDSETRASRLKNSLNELKKMQDKALECSESGKCCKYLGKELTLHNITESA